MRGVFLRIVSKWRGTTDDGERARDSSRSLGKGPSALEIDARSFRSSFRGNARERLSTVLVKIEGRYLHFDERIKTETVIWSGTDDDTNGVHSVTGDHRYRGDIMSSRMKLLMELSTAMVFAKMVSIDGNVGQLSRWSAI